MLRVMLATMLFLSLACNKEPGAPPIGGETPKEESAKEIAILPPEGFVPLAPPPFMGPEEDTDGIAPALIRGRVPDKSEFPGVIWIGNCTATLVGPQMVYTAAHCVGRGGIRFSAGQNSYSAECRTAREYHRGNSTADFALCYVSEPVIGVPYFETINLDKSLVSVGDKVLLSGYGCQRWGRGIDGKYRIGESTVSRVPSGTNSDIVTRNDATLCSGDSGGPAWEILQNGNRGKMLSVNSRSNTTNVSYLSAIGSDIGIRFTNAVLQIYTDAEICGTSRAPQNCLVEGEGPEDPNPPEPERHFFMDHPILSFLALMKPGKEDLLEDAKAAIKSALDSL